MKYKYDLHGKGCGEPLEIRQFAIKEKKSAPLRQPHWIWCIINIMHLSLA